MANNEILRSIRDALNIDDTTMVQVFKESGRDVGLSTISAFLKSEEEDDYIPCTDPVFRFFLEGLIIHKRGRKDNAPSLAPQPVGQLTRNDIIKKLRIALDLKRMTWWRSVRLPTSRFQKTTSVPCSENRITSIIRSAAIGSSRDS